MAPDGGTGAPAPASPRVRAAAFGVHLLTASGAALALLSLFAAAEARWSLMFLWLGLALIVDTVDGPIARRIRVAEVLPRWAGDVLDLVVDFLTYVFIPAFAIAKGGLLPHPVDLLAGVVIVTTGVLYFADRRMKTADNYFRGFPTLWNIVAFYLFVLKPPQWLSAALVALLAIATFLPFKFVHPVRVAKLRRLSLAALVLWSILAAYAVLRALNPGPWVAGMLVVIAIYFVGVGLSESD
jgi:phosphatidylcholine synthase